MGELFYDAVKLAQIALDNERSYATGEQLQQLSRKAECLGTSFPLPLPQYLSGRTHSHVTAGTPCARTLDTVVT